MRSSGLEPPRGNLPTRPSTRFTAANSRRSYRLKNLTGGCASPMLPRSIDARQEHDFDAVAGFLTEHAAYVSLDRQLVVAVAKRHERALEIVSVDGAAHLHEATSTEERC